MGMTVQKKNVNNDKLGDISGRQTTSLTVKLFSFKTPSLTVKLFSFKTMNLTVKLFSDEKGGHDPCDPPLDPLLHLQYIL